MTQLDYAPAPGFFDELFEAPGVPRPRPAPLARRMRLDRVHPFTVYAAQATEVALDAVSRSDGSRSSVARALLATKLPNAPLGPVDFTARGDLRQAPVAVLRVGRAGGSHGAHRAERATVIAVQRGAGF